MNDNHEEILRIAQEECAEVIQSISKIFRFGFTSVSPVTFDSNRTSLEKEVGDLLCMIDLMLEHKLIDAENVSFAKADKLVKLKKWSNIGELYND